MPTGNNKPSKNAQTAASAAPTLSAASLNIDKLDVFIGGRIVGTLARLDGGTTAFEYADSWIADGFALNPLSLPLEKRVFVAKLHPLDGLFGVFDNSLPDGWGRLLVDRFLRERGIDPMAVHPIARLAIVGDSGMGVLEYHPHVPIAIDIAKRSFDELAEECALLLASNSSEDLDTLFAMGGSSGGARPKVFASIDGEDWIVKFPSSCDPEDIGAQEYAIAQVASSVGIKVPEVRLMPSKRCAGYFAIRRFDRIGPSAHPKKVHMVSAGALLETSHRIPNLDYGILTRLILRLTEDAAQVEELYRRMCFNVMIGNRDDHSKNFSFLRSTNTDGQWMLSPAYDLTSNSGMNGEHATIVNGKRRDITAEDIIAAGKQAGIKESSARLILQQIAEEVNSKLAKVISLPKVL